MGLLITNKNMVSYDFQFGFRCFQSTADLLTVISVRIARAFNRFHATQAMALDISRK